jgi:hypothetical protein
MPSFISSPSAAAAINSSGAQAASSGSIRGTIISFTKAILPSLPSSLYDYVPFILAGVMALLFTALLVLLVEDSEDVYPHSPRLAHTDAKQPTKYAHNRRIVSLGQHRNSRDDQGDEDEWELDAWDPRADLDSTNGRNIKQSQEWIEVQNQKRSSPTRAAFSFPSTPRRLLASPPASASPQSQVFTPPMLSMAKLIMHRHDQSTKRSRASSKPSPPPSPPSNTNGTFGHMQYTLKSATLKADKVALMAFPSEPSDSSASRPPSPPRPENSQEAKGQSSSRDLESANTSPSRSQHTRHARSRSITLSISLPSLPSLPPALQMLHKQAAQERAIRRTPSSLLEEGRGSPEPIDEPTHSPERPSSPKEHEESSPVSSDNSDTRRGSNLLVQLEEGAHRR